MSGRRVLGVDEIVEGGLCIGCGLCESLAGSACIEVAMTDAGRERPFVRSPPDAATLRTINAVCPGARVNGADPRRLPPEVTHDAVWGPIAQLVLCHASDPRVRHEGSSGGVLTALGRYLLDSGRVELVLHVAASRSTPMRTAGHASFDRAAVMEGMGSRYGPAAPLRNLCEILDSGRRFALIGKPCDVSAVRNLARVDGRVERLMPYALAMVCGGASMLRASWDALSRFSVDERELALFRYRGHGNPGPTAFETVDGRRFALTYDEMWGDEARWQLQSLCKICPDAIGESADIVAGDTWPGGAPSADDEGFNAVLARTKAGLELFDAAVQSGVVTVCAPLAIRQLDDFNPHQVVKKQAVASRLAAIRAAGAPIPKVRGLRIGRLAWRNSWRANLVEFRGAFRRSRSGRFGEAPPQRERT